MSRKDNVFPKYIKLELDQSNPPSDLYERGSKKCLKCGKNWPGYSIFIPTPCCASNAEAMLENGPDMTWAFAVGKLIDARFDRYYEKWNDHLTDEALLFDASIELPMLDFDEEELRQGLEEIDRITGETNVPGKK